jgi:hypothetical protein
MPARPDTGRRVFNKKGGFAMKIRKEFIQASRAIRQIAKETGTNPIYVWDVAEEKFNIIRGCNCVINQEEIDTIAAIVKKGLL